tara:strand:+ start:900 stop:1712 length:813 start_codon:yes stop_codon:yes gene_type:complete
MSSNEEQIEEHITDGGDINSKVPSIGELPIYLAIKYKYDELFDRILEDTNLDIYAYISSGYTALQYAMLSDKEEYVHKIISYEPVEQNKPDDDGDIFYDTATYNINAQDSHGETALTTAILLPWRLRNKYVDLLLQNGASPNTRSNNGTTPFYHAINTQDEIEDSIIIKKLIEHGARITDILYIHYKDDPMPARKQTYMDVLESIQEWDDMTVYTNIRRMLNPPVKKFSINANRGGKRRRKTKTRMRRKRKTVKKRKTGLRRKTKKSKRK